MNKVTTEEIFAYHQGGKVGMACTKPLTSVRELCLAYTPGVAEAVKAIAANPAEVYRLTAKSRLVAVVSDGTAILGLGDLGAAASIPVMEGKAVLFKAFGDVDGWPVPLNHCRQGGADTGPTDPQRVIDAVLAIAPMYGGINLEDIAAPACFEIEDTLDAMLDIPVFHDDQWGTAVITLAGVKNYCQLCERDLGELRIVVNGAGAAGIRITEMLKAAGARHIVLCDSRGVISRSRAGLTGKKLEHAAETSAKTVGEAMRDAHVFVGVSAADCIKAEDVKGMASFPAVFAMSNPVPEIQPSVVAEVMGKAPYVMATGRSDFPNQINNVLGFPFLFRGALDCGARTINMAMKMAASEALAAVARLPVPPDVAAVYPDETLAFGREYIIPKPFDRRLFVAISSAVVEAAVATGVAAPGTDPIAIRKQLETRNLSR
ncbi:MAG TPA: malate dehydrogenase [Verrucomicrobia bacterium]|nr:malate dehydrogenase [Verrucomicrobiota bacterium]